MNITELLDHLKNGELDEKLSLLYGCDEKTLISQRERYIKAVEHFNRTFPDREDIHLYSAPGRTEIGGNHTDHQHGCALAAAVDLDAVAAVSFHDDGVIRLMSEDYGMSEVDLSDLNVHKDEKGRSVSLLRGIAVRFTELAVPVGGFDAYVVSDVLSGSGLSSSAAFEILIATVINERYGGDIDEIGLAKIGQYAENVYFGKGSGLLDQTVCSVGGMVFIDFSDIDDPLVEKFSFDFKGAGYELIITDTKGSHSDLTDDYTAVPAEMSSVAAYFGKKVLRDVDEGEFYSGLSGLHGKCADRAILRAMHFFGENKRAVQEAEALKSRDIRRFFTLYKASAGSSESLLQNLYSTSEPLEQGIPLAIAVSRRILGESGYVRVHGGGFAGTIQAFVPIEMTAGYISGMEALFGEGSCYSLRIRNAGGIQIV